MAMNLVVEAAAYKDGPVLKRTYTNFPVDVQEAIKIFGEDVVFAGFVKSFTIAEQAKIRASYKAPSNGVRTKRGSALAQIENAKREMAMKEASLTAGNEVE